MVRMSDAAAANRQHLRLEAEAAYHQKLRRARGNLAAFIEVAGRDADGDRIELDYIHRAWIVHVNYAWNRAKNAMIMAPFNSGKTSTMACPLAAFLIGQNPQIRIKMVCANDDMAKQRVGSIKGLIESYEYRKVFPEVRPGKRWDVHDAVVERAGFAHDPTIQARGVLTEGVGGRADIVIFDDICTQRNSEEQASRAKIRTFARGTWLSRLDGPEARAMAFATAWASDDFTNDLKNDPKWCTLLQRIQLPDMEHYEQEVFGAGPDYPVGQIGLSA